MPSGRLEIWAEQERGHLSGHLEVTLEGHSFHSVSLQLKKAETTIGGMTVDVANRAVAQVKVFVLGYSTEAFTTQDDGTFVLPAHAAKGESVHVRAEKPGWEPVEEYPYAGDHTVKLLMRKAP